MTGACGPLCAKPCTIVGREWATLASVACECLCRVPQEYGDVYGCLRSLVSQAKNAYAQRQ